MRSPIRRFVGLALLAVTPTWFSCTAEEQTEYVAGFSTQVRVPRDLKAIRVEISVGGVLQFCQSYRVYDGTVKLPRSLGAIPSQGDGQSSGPVTYTVVGLTEGFSEASRNPLFSDCLLSARVGEDSVRILRRSRQPYVPDEIRFLPMPLKFACYDKDDCEVDETCKGGRCAPSETDTETLPRFEPTLVDGTGADCFSIELCLRGAQPAVVVDSDTCTYAVPNTPSEPMPLEGAPDPIPGESSGEGVNVEVVFDGGLVREVLDKERDEGFFIPDPEFPQRFQLAPGLCDMVRGVSTEPGREGQATPHRISAVRTSGVCRSKVLSQPICAGEALGQMGLNDEGVSPNPDPPDNCRATELKPPAALLMLVVDNTLQHRDFFDEAPEVSVGVPLSDPAFAQTDIALLYAPGDPTNACSTEATLEVPLTSARQARTAVLDSFAERASDFEANPTSTEGSFALDAALERAYTAIAAAEAERDYFRRAVLVVGNREFAADQCIGNSTPEVLASDAASDTANPTDTYVFLLDEVPDGFDAATTVAAANSVANAGNTGQAIDARTDADEGFQGFRRVVESLTTCVYELPKDDGSGEAPVEAGDTLTYTHPVLGSYVALQHDTGCNSEDAAAEGWGFDPDSSTRRLYLCGNACSNFQAALEQAAGINLAYGQPPPPVPMFAHKPGCEPQPPQ